MAKFIPERSCDFTNYPKLFQGTYWGRYKCLVESDRQNETIIGLNRNKFVQLYNLRRAIRGSKRIHKKAELIVNNLDIRDNIEFYSTYDKKIVTLFSASVMGHHEFIIQQGYILFDPLYSTGRQTYIKILQ